MPDIPVNNEFDYHACDQAGHCNFNFNSIWLLKLQSAVNLRSAVCMHAAIHHLCFTFTGMHMPYDYLFCNPSPYSVKYRIKQHAGMKISAEQ